MVERGLSGWGRIGDPAAEESRPKSDHFFEDLVGLGVAGLSGMLGGSEPSSGIDPLLRGDRRAGSCSWALWVRSIIAPAVLGRLSSSFWAEAEPPNGFVSRSAGVMEITDEMLPETEWPGRTVTVLEVSVETRDNGLGMYSSVSEKPTLLRTTGFGVCCRCVAAGDDLLDPSTTCPVGDAGVAFSTSTVLSRAGNGGSGGRSVSAGLVGALPPFTLELDGGTMMEDKSWLEMAADRRWA